MMLAQRGRVEAGLLGQDEALLGCHVSRLNQRRVLDGGREGETAAESCSINSKGSVKHFRKVR